MSKLNACDTVFMAFTNPWFELDIELTCRCGEITSRDETKSVGTVASVVNSSYVKRNHTTLVNSIVTFEIKWLFYPTTRLAISFIMHRDAAFCPLFRNSLLTPQILIMLRLQKASNLLLSLKW